MENNGTNETKCVNYQFNQARAQEVYDFIRAHLDVVNSTPYVEDLMLDLEEAYDFGGGDNA